MTPRWVCTRNFVLTKGKLDFAAESNLKKSEVRFIGVGPEGLQAYSHVAIVAAEVYHQAQDQTREMLDGLLAAYDVEISVYDVQVRVVRPGEEYLRR